MSEGSSPRPGDKVRVVMSKWVDRPHWEYDGIFLGSDDHGGWIGFPAGTPFSRPGADYVATVDHVQLVPAPGPDDQRGWTAVFYAAGGPVRVYVDMTTPPVWDGSVLRAVDLDLDVVQGTTGEVWVDDEEEFAEHRVTYAYPEDVARLAMSSCDRTRHAIESGSPPYDGTSAAWITRLAGLCR